MYIPTHFTATPEQQRVLLTSIEAVDLITPTHDGLRATFLPMLYDAGAHTLQGHVARRNDHWSAVPTGESLVIVHGPDGYITPSWYAAKRAHGRVVPTWNYLLAHIHGTLTVHDDRGWLDDLLHRLTDRHEQDRDIPWALDDAPRAYVEGQLTAIVGVELHITRIEVKAKLGQNRSAADQAGVIDGLRNRGRARDPALADATEQARTP